MYRATKKGGKRHIQRDNILGLKATWTQPLKGGVRGTYRELRY